jgi:hypothetical protein
MSIEGTRASSIIDLGENDITADGREVQDVVGCYLLAVNGLWTAVLHAL